MVQRSIEMGQPIIFATMNYRVNGKYLISPQSGPSMTLVTDFQYGAAFGFLGGREVKDAGIGNIGLHDRALVPVPRVGSC